jgi:hypothetical protein
MQDKSETQRNQGLNVGSEDFTTLTTESAVFWDVMPCGPVDVLPLSSGSKGKPKKLVIHWHTLCEYFRAV